MVNEEEMERIFEKKLFINKRAPEKTQETDNSTFSSNYQLSSTAMRKVVSAIMDEGTEYNDGEDPQKNFASRIDDLRGMSYDYDTYKIDAENNPLDTATPGELSEEDTLPDIRKKTEEWNNGTRTEEKGIIYGENVVRSENDRMYSETAIAMNRAKKVPLREIDSNVVGSETKRKERDGGGSLGHTSIISDATGCPEDESKTEHVPSSTAPKKTAEDSTQHNSPKAALGHTTHQDVTLIRKGNDEAEQEKQLSDRTGSGRQRVVVIDDVPEVRLLDRSSSDAAHVKSEHIRKIEEEFDRFRRVHIESLKFKSKIYRFIYQELSRMEENMGQRLTELERENAQLKERIVFLEDHHRRFRDFVSKGARIWKEQVIDGIREYKKRLDKEYERRVRAAGHVLKNTKEAG